MADKVPFQVCAIDKGQMLGSSSLDQPSYSGSEKRVVIQSMTVERRMALHWGENRWICIWSEAMPPLMRTSIYIHGRRCGDLLYWPEQFTKLDQRLLLDPRAVLCVKIAYKSDCLLQSPRLCAKSAMCPALFEGQFPHLG